MNKPMMILTLSSCCLGLFSQAAFSQEKGTFKDPRDGKVYKTVRIGSQWLMAENLAYKPSSGTYWAYDNDQANVAKYGYLYDVDTATAVAPAGWHLPTQKEFEALVVSLGGFNSRTAAALKEQGSSGFNALFGGMRSGGKFANACCIDWWTSSVPLTVRNEPFTAIFGLNKETDNVFFGVTKDAADGFPVRLFMDSSPDNGPKTDTNRPNLRIERAYSTGSEIAGYNSRVKAPTDVNKRLFVVSLEVPVKAGDHLHPKAEDFLAECGAEKTTAIGLGTPLFGGQMAWTNDSLEITPTKPGTTSFSVVFELASKTSDFRLHWGDSVLDVKIGSSVSK